MWGDVIEALHVSVSPTVITPGPETVATNLVVAESERTIGPVPTFA